MAVGLKGLTMAYKVYIRPISEYCSEVLSPYLYAKIYSNTGFWFYSGISVVTE